ncbi:MAG: alpha/beta hydrolase [Solirubrobacterales bacterium]
MLSGPLSVEKLRANARRNARTFARPRTDVASVRELEVPGGAGPVPARHYLPAEAPAGAAPPLLVFAHGGGYMVGDLDSHEEACRMLCRHGGVAVVSIDYRLAPEYPYPAGVEDLEAAFAWARESASDLGADPDRVGVGGDSAGGNLSAVVCQRLRDRGEPLPALQLLIYPGTDFAGEHLSHETYGEGLFLVREDLAAARSNYIPEGVDPADAGVSPLRAPHLGGLPPAVVVTAAFDPIRDEGEAYVSALAEAGVVVAHRRFPGLIHGFINMTNVNPTSWDATVAIAGMLRAGFTVQPAPGE